MSAQPAAMPPAPPSNAARYIRIAMIAVALFLPLVSLVVLGGLWLWQSGVMIYWALTACSVTASLYLLQAWLFDRRKGAPPKSAPGQSPLNGEALNPASNMDAPDPSWTPAEHAAWQAVANLADTVDPDQLISREALVALGLQTIETVARQIHPEQTEPLWQFTVPEALTLIERVSGKLRPFVTSNIPLGDTLTVGQMLALYRWRSTIGVAQKAYDLWRVIRMLNPVTAATQELREQISKKMYEWGRTQLTKRLAAAYVSEVGRAAIDLYGGRLRVTPEALAGHVSPASQRDLVTVASPRAEPLRILIAGQIKAGKSSLVNALSKEVRAAVDALPATAQFTPYALKLDGTPDGAPAALLIDSPGLDNTPAALARLTGEAGNCDLVIWVINAARADREGDRAGIAAFRDYFAAHLNRRRPPMMLVLSHIDRLRPFQDWQPPYDLAHTSGDSARSAKANSILAAMDAAATELGFELADVVPVCLDGTMGHYNLDSVWAKITSTLPDAQAAQLVRCLGDARKGTDWRRVWQQSVNAGRVISKTLVR